MTVMTVGANRRAHVAARDGFRVHTFAVRQKNLVADAAALHDRLVAMTTPAGLSDVRAIDRRFWIARRQRRRHVAIASMTIAARRSLRAAVLFRLRVKAVVVTFVWLNMKERAGQVRKLFARSVTSLALKIRRRGRRRCGVWSTDDRAFVWMNWSRARIQIGLSFR